MIVVCASNSMWTIGILQTNAQCIFTTNWKIEIEGAAFAYRVFQRFRNTLDLVNKSNRLISEKKSGVCNEYEKRWKGDEAGRVTLCQYRLHRRNVVHWIVNVDGFSFKLLAIHMSIPNQLVTSYMEDRSSRAWWIERVIFKIKHQIIHAREHNGGIRCPRRKLFVSFYIIRWHVTIPAISNE